MNDAYLQCKTYSGFLPHMILNVTIIINHKCIKSLVVEVIIYCFE